jgi:tRNA(adenine34) deaminase
MAKPHEYFIREALKEAKKALKKDEVPVGAVVVLAGKIIGKGHNENISLNDPTAHAEIQAIRQAALKLKNYRLNGCKLYVTVEPCAMCAGAMVWARVSEIIYGAPDVKAGACGSVFNIVSNKKLNHRIKVMDNVLEKQCRETIQKFFRKKRSK